jgi:hypothetical protein
MEGEVARILRFMLVLAAAGTLAGFALLGWEWGAGFLLGALASYLNFRWLKQVVDALGGARPKARLAVFLGLRYLLLAGAAYVIVSYSTLSLPAALTGLFVCVAAVIMEIVFELVYARY